MAGDEERHPKSEAGQRERSAYLTIAVVFLLSCGLAAAALAIHENGGLGSLFGPRLDEFEIGAAPITRPDPGSKPSPRPETKAGSRTKPRTALKAAVGGPDPLAQLEGGRLFVRCSRPCRVTVDGEIVGEAAPVLKLKHSAGDHQVRVEELDGENYAHRRVLVAPDKVSKIHFTLGGKTVVKDSLNDLSGTEDWD